MKGGRDVIVYKSLEEFYPFYLTEHRDPVNRTLHFIGSSLVLITLLWIIVTSSYNYGFAWVGHFFFEKNKPATFKYPLYSFTCDWIMWKDIIVGNQPMAPKKN